MKRKMKKAICMAVIGALALTSAAGNNVTSQAAKKIKLSKKSVTVTAKKSKTVKIKNVKAKQVKKLTVKSNKKNIATAKKSGKTKVKVTGKKAGSAKVTVKVTLKGKKKATKLTLKVTVKKAATTKKDTPTTVPSSSPAVTSGTPAPTTAATTAVNPTNAPATDAPATDAPATDKPETTLKPTKTPKPSPGPTATPNIIDLDKYDFDIKSELWTQYYDTVTNADGSITLTRNKGDADWQVGEFGFAIPRDKVGDIHQFTRVVIKFRDSDLTDDSTQCGYVFHMGDDTNVGWIDTEDGGHPNTLSFNGSGETVIYAGETKSGESESNFSTIRIFDGKMGGKITIESVRLEKGAPPTEPTTQPTTEPTTKPTTPPVDTGSVESGTVESGTVESGSTESPNPTTPPEPTESDLNIQNDIWKQYCDVVNNADGSVTLMINQGSQSWQAGEFGIAIPADDVGKFKKVIIKYRDSDITGDTPTCGYVFHMGTETNPSWIAGESGHDNTLKFNGSGEAVIEPTEAESDFSTVRVYGGKTGGKITIESITLAK